jgi:RHS repeat-associated protein
VKKSNGTLYWTGPGWDPLLETDLSGNATAEYVFFNGERAARVDMPGNSPKYYFEDHLGSTDIVTNPTGGIVEESDYVPYRGEIVINGSDPNHFKFTGKERDLESGLDYFDARHYSSPFGRFLTPDWAAKPTDVPYANFGNPQSLNLYSYVQNNPTTMGDPDGHQDPCGCDLLSPHQAYVIDQTTRFWASVTWQVLQQDAKVISNALEKGAEAVQQSGFGKGAMAGSDPIPGLKDAFLSKANDSDATRRQAQNDAKRDANVPTSQQPEKQENVPVTDQNGKQVVDENGKPQTSREYTHTTGTGDKVVIQDHSQGHTYADGAKEGPHFNVRPADDTRHGQVPGTKAHYRYKKKH